MTASRKEYMGDLLIDIKDVLDDYLTDHKDSETIIAAMILADSLNGLRKGLHAAVASYLTIQGELK
jgi:hypothetical protein